MSPFVCELYPFQTTKFISDTLIHSLASLPCISPGVPQILEVGCYVDAKNNRALSTMYANLRKQIDWQNLRSMVTKCAERAFALGFKYFGVQFFGECWGDKSDRPAYDRHGEGRGCYEGTSYSQQGPFEFAQFSFSSTKSHLKLKLIDAYI